MTMLRRQAFALAKALLPDGSPPEAAADLLRDRVGGSLRSLNDQQWRKLIAQLREDQSRREAPGCGFAQWQRIQALRRQLGWDMTHLRNYMKKIAQVEHERFLDAAGARAMLAGLQKMTARTRAAIPATPSQTPNSELRTPNA